MNFHHFSYPDSDSWVSTIGSVHGTAVLQPSTRAPPRAPNVEKRSEPHPKAAMAERSEVAQQRVQLFRDPTVAASSSRA